MKKFFVTILLVISLIPAVFSFDRPAVRLGLKASPVLSWIRPETRGYRQDGFRIGYTYGFISDFRLGEFYALSTGFNVSFMRGALEYEALFGNPPRAQLLNRSYFMQYVEVPLTIKMHTQEIGYITYFGQIGIGTGIRLRARANDFYPADLVTVEVDDIAADTRLMRGSLIIGGGIKYSLGGTTAILAGLTFNNGFTNILKGTNPVTGRTPSAISNYLELTVGVMF
ncbi:MAG TPA: porin family protein [Bacteroidales bacterium]|nr:porin family protein [Bacteroidales bacterium]